MSPSGYEPLPLGGAHSRQGSHAAVPVLRRLRGGSSLRLKAVLLALALGAYLLVHDTAPSRATTLQVGLGRPAEELVLSEGVVGLAEASGGEEGAAAEAEEGKPNLLSRCPASQPS